MRGIFITGTSTGVGKTLVAAGLAWALRKRKVDVGIMKPFATANSVFSAKYRSQDTAILAKASGVNDPDCRLNPFFYPIAASPFMASELNQGAAVNINKAVHSLKDLGKRHDFLIVEGIGGIMVPLTENEYFASFAKRVDMPIIIVTTAKLGTLNHTLLTVMACEKYGLKITGIILNKIPKKPNIVEQKTAEVIERLTHVKVLALVPFSQEVSYPAIGKVLDHDLNLDKILSMQ